MSLPVDYLRSLRKRDLVEHWCHVSAKLLLAMKVLQQACRFEWGGRWRGGVDVNLLWVAQRLVSLYKL